jgi:hypothetical protein
MCFNLGTNVIVGDSSDFYLFVMITNIQPLICTIFLPAGALLHEEPRLAAHAKRST